MQITIDTSVPLNDSDKAFLSTLLGLPVGSTIVTEPARTPAKAPAKAPAKPVVEEPAEEPAEEEEDLIGGELTVADAVDAATVLVNSGGQAKVKAALKSIGADRVSNIPTAKVADFIAALNA